MLIFLSHDSYVIDAVNIRLLHSFATHPLQASEYVSTIESAPSILVHPTSLLQLLKQVISFSETKYHGSRIFSCRLEKAPVDAVIPGRKIVALEAYSEYNYD